MAWTDRQQAMLREMGLRLWLPAAAAPEPAPQPVPLATAPAPPPAIAPAAARLTPAVSAPLPLAARMDVREPGGEEPRAVASLEWSALQAAVAGCRACGLCATRRQTVFGVGHLQAHCMVVGEAPGEQEDAQGEPFVGAAGQLLDRMLAALGLGRAPATPERQVFIANTLKCRPPRNRNPSPEELASCQPFLERQVALVQPRVILAMGRFAVQQLLGSDEPIGRLRGTVHRWRGVPLVVSYHPAYLLRQPADKAKAWDDLCRVAELLGQPPA